MKQAVKKITKGLGIHQSLKHVFRGAAQTQRRLKTALLPSALILMYHRVTELADDPHELAVTPEYFRAQLEYIKKHMTILPLQALIKKLEQGTLSKEMVAITFDDGYYDNVRSALPILSELNVPATIFVTAGKVDDPTPFDWDAPRQQPATDRAVRIEELRELAQHPLIEIGAHTLTHPHLAALTQEEQRHEIVQSKKKLEEYINQPVAGFAYPFGGRADFTRETQRLVREAGFTYACAVLSERVRLGADRYALPRYPAKNWSPVEFPQALHSLI